MRSVWLLRCRAVIDWCILLVKVMVGSGGRYVLEFLEGAVDVVVYGDV